MAAATIERYTIPAPGALQSKFVIEGVADCTDTKTQSQGIVPVPFAADDRTILVNLSGQTRTFNISFILLQRDDDFTGGSGSAGDGSPDTQKAFLQDTIFHPRGYHLFTDTDGEEYSGRIESSSIRKSGDDPLKYDVTITFIRGVVAGA